jgi:hypothetical protein
MQPVVKPLSYFHRNFIFITLTVIFALSLPAFIFYGMGYRYSFFAETPTITVTGGLFIASEVSDIQIYIDDIDVNNARVFRKASYIQGVEPGLHKVHVQSPGLHTWVKDLLVNPQIVTEAEAFNLPLRSQVRPVTEYLTKQGEVVYFGTATSTNLFIDSSSSLSIIFSNKKATSTLVANSEYKLINEMFIEKASSTASRLAWEKIQESEKFGFATTSRSMPEINYSTTTVVSDKLMLYKNGEDVFVKALGIERQIPHYFCTTQLATSTNSNLGAVYTSNNSSSSLITDNTNNEQPRVCRTDIRIDRKWQTVHDFNFLPSNTNLILMQLDDGVHVVEIDDRSWQNAQLLYPGKDLEMLIYGGSIFIKDRGYIFEALTTIPVK